MNKKEPVVLNSEVEMSKTLQIRNSTIDFLVFTKQNSQDSIEVRVQDENVWLTQDGISRLFDVDRSVVTKHLKNVFETNELEEISVCAKFAHTAADGKTYNTKFYNLDAIISVGYRVNSIRALQPGCRHDKGVLRECAERVALGYPPAYGCRTHYGTRRCEKDAHGLDDLAQGA